MQHEILSLIRDKIQPFLEKCRRLFAGTDYALQYVRTQIQQIKSSSSNELKEKLIEKIDDFIVERIVYA